MPLPVSIALLGPAVACRGDGARLPPLPKKAWVLLAFLLGHPGRGVAREDLAALLWSNTESEQARQSLRQCLTVLRRWLPPETVPALLVTSDTIGLAADGSFECDLHEVERLAGSQKRAELECVEARFRGRFLEGLAVPGEPAEDWLAQERERLALLRLDCLQRLAEALARDEGDQEAAIAVARRLSALDPLREESSRLLMRLLAATGQRGLALVEHARVERRLRAELGLAPDKASRLLAERIRRGEPIEEGTIAAGTGPAMQAEMPSCPSLGAPPHHLLSDRPGVALLPLAAHAEDKEIARAALELTEQVAAMLVRNRWPIALTTAEHASVATSARYVVSGAVRRRGASFRILLRLVDATSARHFWSGQLDPAPDEVLAVGDELSACIAAQIAAAIRSEEVERVSRRQVDLLSGYELHLLATAICRRGREGNARALTLLSRAIAQDPKLGVAHALAARCFHLQRLMGWARPDDKRLYSGVRLAHRAAELGENDPEALWMSGLALAILDGNFADGRFLMDRSLRLNPNNASAWIGSSFLRTHAGDPEMALDHFKQAQNVDPDDTSQHVPWYAAALAYFVAGRVEEADQATDKALLQRGNYPGSLRMKIATSALLGRVDLAQANARRLLMVNPDANVAATRDYWRPVAAHAPEAVASLVDGWRKAGMPEG